MSTSALLNRFGTTYSITRYNAGGSYVNGSWVDAGTSSLSTKMSLQPITGAERLELEEGQRTKRILKGYSE